MGISSFEAARFNAWYATPSFTLMPRPNMDGRRRNLDLVATHAKTSEGRRGIEPLRRPSSSIRRVPVLLSYGRRKTIVHRALLHRRRALANAQANCWRGFH
jgi:hypothetical protein